jgi:hypothetical protein
MHRRAALTLSAAVLGAALAGGAASAAVIHNSIPAGDGTIKGCYDAAGVLSVIDSAATCPALSTELDWAQAGPQGAPGLSGVNVQTFNPTSPHNTTAVNTLETFDCSGGQTMIYAVGKLYDPINGTNTTISLWPVAEDVPSTAPVGAQFLIPNNWNNTYATLTISLTCATTS